MDGLLSLVSGQVPAGRMTFTPGMVRGLSYYTGPIWELVTPAVTGSIGGGGRYDHLIADLGGPDVPATGGGAGHRADPGRCCPAARAAAAGGSTWR